MSSGFPRKRSARPLIPFGGYLRIGLKWKHLSASALAHALDLNPSTVNGYFTGTQPARETVVRIVSVLGITNQHALLLLHSAGYCTDEEYQQVMSRLALTQDLIFGEGERFPDHLPFAQVMHTALRYAHMNESLLADASGVREPAVNNAMSGENRPRRELVLLWCRVLEAPPLLTEHLCHALHYCTEEEERQARDLLIWRDVITIGPEVLLTSGPSPNLSMPPEWEMSPSPYTLREGTEGG